MKNFDWSLFKRYWQILKPFVPYQLIALLCMSINIIISLLQPLITQVTIDQIIVQKDIKLFLTFFIGSTLAVFVISNLFSFLQTYLNMYIGNFITFNIRFRLLRHVENLPISFFKKHLGGDLVTRIDSDSYAIHELVSNTVAEIISNVFTLSFTLVFIIVIDWRICVAIFIFIPIYVFMFKYFGAALNANWEKIRNTVSLLNSFLFENFSAIMNIKAFCLEKRQMQSFISIYKNMFRLFMRTGVTNFVFQNGIGFFETISSMLVTTIAVLGVMKGDMTIGTLFAVLDYSGRIFGTTRTLANMNINFQVARASMDRISYLFNQKNDIIEPEKPVHRESIKGNIEFKNVGFSYDNENKVLHNINLKIQAGKTLAFVGPSGSGKSTMANLLLRLYDPLEGVIELDGIDYKMHSSTFLRGQFGYVSQDAFLWNDTIRNNIKYGNIHATDEEIITAAKGAFIHDFIMTLPDKYDTNVGERGGNLSGGQRQRICIARALVRNPKILLMDEATSALDPEAEREIKKCIDAIAHERTVIMIAHRLTTVIDADTIVYMENGMIKEVGNHQELVSMKGIYYNFIPQEFRTTDVGTLLETLMEGSELEDKEKALYEKVV